MSPESKGGGQSGKLNPKALKKALYFIENNRCIGNIHVTKGDDEKHIYFTVGGIRLLSSGNRRKTPLGKLLVRYGKLSPSQMREALLTQKRSGRRIGEVLTKVLKFLDPSDIDEVVQVQVENEIFDIITWEEGVFEFTRAMPDSLFNKKLKATTLSTDIPLLIDRIKARIDEWPGIQEKVPDFGGVYRLTRSGHRRLVEGTDEGVARKELAGFLDGKRPLAHVIDEGEFGRFETCKMVALFLEKDWAIRVGGTSDWGPVADASDVFEEIQMLERALDLNPEDSEVRTRLAGAFEKGGLKGKASLQARILADEKLKAGKGDQAIALLEKAIKLNPTDFESHERLFESYGRFGKMEKAIRHGLRLAETYKANRLFNRTKNVLNKILEWRPRNTRAHTLLGETHEELQESQSAVRAFEAVAAFLKEEGKDEKRLKEIFERILGVDPRHKTARKELGRIARMGRRDFALLLRTVLLVLFTFLAFGAVGYEFTGRFLYGQMAGNFYEAVRKGEFDRAGEALETYRARFPIIDPEGLAAVSGRLEEVRMETRANEAMRFVEKEEAVFNASTPELLEDMRSRITEKLDAEGEIPEGPVRDRLTKLLERVQTVLVPWTGVVSAVKSGGHEAAFRAYQKLKKDFPEFKPEKTFPAVYLPLEVQPKEAEVYLNGELVGKGVERLVVKIGKVSALKVSHPGYQSLETSVDVADAAWPLAVSLSKKVAWKTALGGPVYASPLVHENEIFVTSVNRCLTCLDLPSGNVKWRFRAGLHADLDTPPVLREDGILFFTARDDHLYALLPGSLEPLHREPLGAYCNHAPLIFNEKDAPKAIFALEDMRILVKPPELAGKTETVFRAEGTLAAGPAEFEGILVFGDRAGDLYAFDLLTAELKWKTHLGAPVTAPPTLHEGIAFVGTREGKLFAIDIAEGKVLPGWPFKAEAPITTTPVVHGELLLAGGETGHLTALNRLGGTFSWKICVDAAIRSKPFTIGYTVYLGADDGALYALDIPGRAIRWKFQTGGPIRGAPVLSEGMVLFGSGDGNFYAVKE